MAGQLYDDNSYTPTTDPRDVERVRDGGKIYPDQYPTVFEYEADQIDNWSLTGYRQQTPACTTRREATKPPSSSGWIDVPAWFAFLCWMLVLALPALAIMTALYTTGQDWWVGLIMWVIPDLCGAFSATAISRSRHARRVREQQGWDREHPWTIRRSY